VWVSEELYENLSNLVREKKFTDLSDAVRYILRLYFEQENPLERLEEELAEIKKELKDIKRLLEEK